LVPDEIEGLQGVRACFEAPDRGEGECSADVAPVASARAALHGTVPDQISMSYLVTDTSHREFEGIFIQAAEKLPRAQPEVQVIHLERRCGFADQGRRRAKGPFSGRADLAEDLPRP